MTLVEADRMLRQLQYYRVVTVPVKPIRPRVSTWDHHPVPVIRSKGDSGAKRHGACVIVADDSLRALFDPLCACRNEHVICTARGNEDEAMHARHQTPRNERR